MSLNKVQLIGHLGADPEIRYTAQESAVATFNVATSRTWRDKKTNEKKEATEWHRVIFWNRLAEVAGEYLRKGSHIYVEGALKTRKYEDKNGVERYVTEIIGQRLDMLGGKPKEDKNAMPNASTESNEPPHIDEDGLLDIDQFDDDIPF